MLKASSFISKNAPEPEEVAEMAIISHRTHGIIREHFSSLIAGGRYIKLKGRKA